MKKQIYPIMLIGITALLIVLLIVYYLLFINPFTPRHTINFVFMVISIVANGSLGLYLFSGKNKNKLLPIQIQMSYIGSTYTIIVFFITLFTALVSSPKVIFYIHLVGFSIFLISEAFTFMSLKNAEHIEDKKTNRNMQFSSFKELFMTLLNQAKALPDDYVEINKQLRNMELDIKYLPATNNAEAWKLETEMSEMINSIIESIKKTEKNDLNEDLKKCFENLFLAFEKRKKIKSN
jgi:hypothetical protein